VRLIVSMLISSLVGATIIASPAAMAQTQIAAPQGATPVAVSITLNGLGGHDAEAPAIQRIVQQGPGICAGCRNDPRGIGLAMQRMFHLSKPPPGARTFSDISNDSPIASAVASVACAGSVERRLSSCALVGHSANAHAAMLNNEEWRAL
jgi:hypothetical protein